MTLKEQELIQLAHWINDPKIKIIIVLLMVWTLCWKGVALWRAARNESKNWYVALLVLNTVGILEIIYIFFFSNKKNKV